MRRCGKWLLLLIAVNVSVFLIHNMMRASSSTTSSTQNSGADDMKPNPGTRNTDSTLATTSTDSSQETSDTDSAGVSVGLIPFFRKFSSSSLRKRFENSRRNETVHILMPEHKFFNSFFNFFMHPESTTKTCTQKCQLHMSSQFPIDVTHDALFVHAQDCDRNYKTSFPQDPPHLLLQALIRNEPDALVQYGVSAADAGFAKCYHNYEAIHTDISISFHRNSTVWGNYMYNPVHRSVQQIPHAIKDSQFHGACTFISNCVEHRIETVKTLGKYIPLRNYGYCLNNIRTSLAKTQELANCKIYLAFENSHLSDYISEKFFEGFSIVGASVLTVYMGAPNIDDAVDFPKSYINGQKFPSADALGEYLKNILNDEKEFYSYFEWKKSPEQVNRFQNAMETMYRKNVHFSPCKLCAAVAEIKLARKILDELGFKPQQGNTYLKRKEYEQLVQSVKVPFLRSDLDILFDVGYTSFWRKGNHAVHWNDIEYACEASPLDCFRPN